MRIPNRLWRWVAVGLVVLIAIGLAVRAWVVPAIILNRLQARYDGHVTIRDWWLNGRSSGVIGLTLHEGRSPSSPVWASAERVATDLSLGSLLAGRTTPRTLVLRSPRLTFRIDQAGRLLTRPPLKSSAQVSTAPPDIKVENAQVTFHQEGRPEMVVAGVFARMSPESGGAVITAQTEDPHWGAWLGSGRLDSSFRNGDFRLASPRVSADPEKVKSIPFIPSDVWTHVQPRGPIGVTLLLKLAGDGSSSLNTRVELRLDRTEMGLPTLGVTATDATGALVIENAKVQLNQVEGRAIGGTIRARGALDFSQAPARFDLNLGLQKVDVARAPRSWQLDQLGATGRLTGEAHLKVALGTEETDLTGTTGEAVIEGGTLQGIPVKSLRLVMRAEGQELHYETPRASADLLRPALLTLLEIVFQVPKDAKQNPASASKKSETPAAANQERGSAPAGDGEAPRGLRLPRSITTEIELEDVDLMQVVARAEALGLHVPVPLGGKLSLKAQATIPLGALRDVREYVFHGEASLTGASIAGVDLGRLTAKLVLDQGVLELSDFRGRLVNRPAGGPGDLPPSTEQVPAEGPLPAGGFRGMLRAELSPPGRLTASFTGNTLPLGEVLAPAFPKPTPVAGDVTFDFDAQAHVATISDPRAWALTGRVKAVQARYRGTILDAASTRLEIKQGRLVLSDLAARMSGQPLQGRLDFDLSAPHALSARVDVAGWSLANLLALIPGVPAPAPVAGKLTANAEAEGQLAPLALRTRGSGKLDQFQTGPLALGNVPFRWATDDHNVLSVYVVESRPFGGRMSGEAHVPLEGNGAIEGALKLADIDTAKLAATLPGTSLKLTGRADGKASFTVHPDTHHWETDIHLAAANLTVQGVPASAVQASVRSEKDDVAYEITADSLGGKVRFQGKWPIHTQAKAKPAANAELRASDFELAALWTALQTVGPIRHLSGLGALDANIRVPLATHATWVHGLIDLRDLRWGRHFPLGALRGELAMTPTGWRLDPLTGELLGGHAQGKLWGVSPTQGPRQLGFAVEVDRVALAQVAAILPSASRHVVGYGSLRLSGRFEEGLQAKAEVHVPRARVYGLTLMQLVLPADMMVSSSGAGSLHLRRWSARLSGGRIHGNARFLLGADESFHAETYLSAVDLEALARALSEARNPAAGKISGQVVLFGPSPARLDRLRGKVDIDLTDASLVDLPVLREVDRFLGAARGGVFEEGDFLATIGNKQMTIDQCTLVGRAVQLHAVGTIGFDTQLNLVVLVNTSQLIPQTGEALLALIPGLRTAMARSEEVTMRVANFLANRLLKFRVTGTLRNPVVSLDPAVVVSEDAASFFTGVLKLPLSLAR